MSIALSILEENLVKEREKLEENLPLPYKQLNEIKYEIQKIKKLKETFDNFWSKRIDNEIKAVQLKFDDEIKKLQIELDKKTDITNKYFKQKESILDLENAIKTIKENQLCKNDIALNAYSDKKVVKIISTSSSCQETDPCSHGVNSEYDDGTTIRTNMYGDKIGELYIKLGQEIPKHFTAF